MDLEIGCVARKKVEEQRVEDEQFRDDPENTAMDGVGEHQSSGLSISR